MGGKLDQCSSTRCPLHIWFRAKTTVVQIKTAIISTGTSIIYFFWKLIYVWGQEHVVTYVYLPCPAFDDDRVVENVFVSYYVLTATLVDLLTDFGSSNDTYYKLIRSKGNGNTTIIITACRRSLPNKRQSVWKMFIFSDCRHWFVIHLYNNLWVCIMSIM